MIQFIVTGICCKQDEYVIDNYLETRTIEAASKDEAVGLMIRFMKARYRVEEGHKSHQVWVFDMGEPPFDIRAAIAKLEADR